MNANWWAMQKIIEFRQAEIAKAARLRSVVSLSGSVPQKPQVRTLSRLRQQAGRLLLRWGFALYADQADDQQRYSPLHA